jgi:PAS domain S-box-containing protein
MSSDVVGARKQADLRLSALKRLTGQTGSHETRLDSSAAFRALYELATSPSTAPSALALLHELQVYQVELDLQDEELRRSRAELEVALMRQVQLYDFAPVGFFTVDRSTVLRELNLTAAGMLGSERDQLLGRTLDSFLAPQSAHALHTMLTRLRDDAPTEVGALQLRAGRSVNASVNRDPDGLNFLVAFVRVAEHEGRPAD